MDFSFYMPTQVIGGKNAVLYNENVFERLSSKCLIVTGGNSAKLSGALDDVTAVLENVGTSFTVYNKITQNPNAADCCYAGQLARRFSADYIIGIGGGSALDAAKAIAVYSANDYLGAEDIYTSEIRNRPLPLVLVGTTAGTGSEVTGVSVLTRSNGKKKSVSGSNYYATVSLCDPKYTYSLPYKFTVSTAIDAFSHASEAYFSNKLNDNAKMYAEKSLVPLWNCLRYFYKAHTLPNEDMRDELYYSSLFAGMALNICGTCYPHTMGYALTEDHGLSHGFACAAFLPSFVRRAVEYKSDLAEEYFNLLKTNIDELEKVLNSLVDTSSVKMTSKQIDAYCESWENVKNFNNSPGSFNKDDAKALLVKMFL